MSVTHEDHDAITNATAEQVAAWRRLKARCSIRGVLLLSDGTLQIGFESNLGRDREAIVAPDGRRLATYNSHAYR
jgi:hypothetical protein